CRTEDSSTSKMRFADIIPVSFSTSGNKGSPAEEPPGKKAEQDRRLDAEDEGLKEEVAGASGDDGEGSEFGVVLDAGGAGGGGRGPVGFGHEHGRAHQVIGGVADLVFRLAGGALEPMLEAQHRDGPAKRGVHHHHEPGGPAQAGTA